MISKAWAPILRKMTGKPTVYFFATFFNIHQRMKSNMVSPMKLNSVYVKHIKITSHSHWVSWLLIVILFTIYASNHFLFAGRDEEIRQPLSRKVPIPSSKINPYRAVVLIRLVALAFFFRYRLVNPVPNAYGLWLTSIICEVWFTLSWILDQLPKLQPVNRETYPERLCLR